MADLGGLDVDQEIRFEGIKAEEGVKSRFLNSSALSPNQPAARSSEIGGLMVAAEIVAVSFGVPPVLAAVEAVSAFKSAIQDTKKGQKTISPFVQSAPSKAEVAAKRVTGNKPVQNKALTKFGPFVAGARLTGETEQDDLSSKLAITKAALNDNFKGPIQVTNVVSYGDVKKAMERKAFLEQERDNGPQIVSGASSLTDRTNTALQKGDEVTLDRLEEQAAPKLYNQLTPSIPTHLSA